VDQFRRVLEVRVDDQDDVAGGIFQTGDHRVLVSEIARKTHHPAVRVAGAEGGQYRERVIVGAVVDEDDLVIAFHALNDLPIRS